MAVKLSTSAKKIVMKRGSTPGAIGWPESIRLRTIPMGANIANDRSALASSLVACCSSAISLIRDRASICSPNDKERMRLIVSATISIGLDTRPAMTYMSALSITTSANMSQINRRLVRSSSPTKSAVGVTTRTCQIFPEPVGIWLNSATYSASSGPSLKVNRSGLPAARRRTASTICGSPASAQPATCIRPSRLWTAFVETGCARRSPCSSAMTVMLLGLALCLARSSESPRNVMCADATPTKFSCTRIG